MLAEGNFNTSGCPYLVQICSSNIDYSGRLRLLMPLYGETIEALIMRYQNAGQRVPFETVAGVFYTVSSALQYLHDLGFLHM